MLQALKSRLRGKLRELNSLTSVDGNYIYIYREVIYQQGFWPSLDRINKTPTSRFRYWNPRLILASLVYFTLVGLPMAAYWSQGQSTFDRLESAIFAFATGVCAATTGSLLYKSDLFQESVDAFKAMSTSARFLPVRSRKILERRKKICDMLFYALCVFLVLAIFIVLLLQPYFIVTKTFFFQAWYPYDEKLSPYFEFTLVVWLILIVPGIIQVFTGTVLLCTILVQAWSHLELLCHNLTVIRESALRKTTQTADSTPVTKQMRYQSWDNHVSTKMALILHSCVRHHYSVERLISTIEPAFSIIKMQIHLALIIPFGLIIFSIQHIDGLSLSIVWQLIYLESLVVSLLVICFLADKISEQSELVRDAAFSCDWIDAPESLKRSLRIVMSRCNKPLVINVAGGVSLSLDTFGQLLYLSYRYYKFVSNIG